MRNLLLVSSSTVHGSGYLEHCEAHVRELFKTARTILFVPYALHDRAAYTDAVRKRFSEMEIEVVSIHETPDPRAAVEEAQGIFIGGGNTFRLLKTLYDDGIVETIRGRCMNGLPYMGTSAGSNIACQSIMTTNDMPIVLPPTFDALRLVPFQLNAHYLDPDPASTHKGETRVTRIKEFHEENSTPVIGIREGAMLVVEGDVMRLDGTGGGKLFRRGQEPEECPPGSVLDELLTRP
jgi:dipeptidase E